MPPQAAE